VNLILSYFLRDFNSYLLLLFWNRTSLTLVHFPRSRRYIELSKSHATHIKIFIDGCNSVQFDWINKHTISLWLYKSPRRSRHVVTCSCQSVSWLQTVEVQGCLSQVQPVFIVEHYLESRSCLSCQNEFRDTFPDSPVPNKSTISQM
jgi:hypothetical protein